MPRVPYTDSRPFGWPPHILGDGSQPSQARPDSENTDLQQAPDKPSPTMIAMAAAIMHEQGRLFEKPTQLAGDVLPLPIQGGANTGPTNKSADYAVGKSKDSKVEPLPIGTLKDWMTRTSSRK